VFKYAVNTVPQVINECLLACKIPFKSVNHFFLHQANGKMLEAISHELLNLNGATEMDLDIPMNLQKTGNTSVATIPTLLDEVLGGDFPSHRVNEGDIAVMASVGAGMHANCLVYKF
jgi:3-oxoacyl-[acyl-carrier-protein] synthase-3